MEIERRDVGRVTVLRPEDRFDILGYLDLEETLAEVLGEGRKFVVLDLSRVTFANSSSLAVLVRFAREAEMLGGTLVLAAVNSTVEKLLGVIGVRRDAVEMYDTVEQALAALGEHAADTTA